MNIFLGDVGVSVFFAARLAGPASTAPRSYRPTCHDVARPAGSVPTALTAEQAEIVATARSPGTQPVPLAVLVTAGAGTGKTTVLEAVVAKPESVGHTAGQCV